MLNRMAIVSDKAADVFNSQNRHRQDARDRIGINNVCITIHNKTAIAAHKSTNIFNAINNANNANNRTCNGTNIHYTVGKTTCNDSSAIVIPNKATHIFITLNKGRNLIANRIFVKNAVSRTGFNSATIIPNQTASVITTSHNSNKITVTNFIIIYTSYTTGIILSNNCRNRPTH